MAINYDSLSVVLFETRDWRLDRIGIHWIHFVLKIMPFYFSQFSHLMIEFQSPNCPRRFRKLNRKKGIHLTGKSIWKKREVEKSEMKLERLKLESSSWSWKARAQVEKYNWSWKLTHGVGKFKFNLERINEVRKLSNFSLSNLKLSNFSSFPTGLSN